MIYVDDAYGGSFQQSMRQAVNLRNMTMYAYALKPGSREREVDRALTFLLDNNVNYIVGLFYPTDYELIMGQAWKLGLAGEGKLWIYTAAIDPALAGNGGKGSIMDPNSPAAKATPGNMVFHDEGGLPGFPQYDRFLQEWKQIAEDDEALNYINSKVPPWNAQAFFANGTVFEFNRTSEYFLRNPGYIAAYSYDAVVALGIGACYAQGNLSLATPISTSSNASSVSRMDLNSTFTGNEHHTHALLSKFLGASGFVSFNLTESYSRDPNTTYFVVSNIREQKGDDGKTTFRAVPTRNANTTTNEWTSYRDRAFVYPGGTTEPPPDLPPAETVLLHLDPAARGICLGLSGLAMLASLFFIFYNFETQKSHCPCKPTRISHSHLHWVSSDGQHYCSNVYGHTSRQ